MTSLRNGAVLVLALHGCSSSPDAVEDPLAGLQTQFSEVVPTVLTVSWQSDLPGPSWVQYRYDDVVHSTPKTDGGTVHEVVVLGLKAGRKVDVQGFTDTEDGPVSTTISSVQPDDVPGWFSELQMTDGPGATSEMDNGYMLMSISKGLGGFEGVGSAIAIIDGDGDYVWWHDVDEAKGSMSPTFRNGDLMWDEYDSLVAGDLATVAMIDLAATKPLVRLRIPEGHHMVVPLSPDEIGWIARDFNELVGAQGTPVTIQTDHVRVSTLDTTDTPTELFSVYSAYEGVFHYPCLHTLTAYERDGFDTLFEWSHANSLVYLPEQRAFFMNSRWTDTIWKIDRDSGELLWQLGGPNSDFTFPDGSPIWDGAKNSPLFSHGHYSQLWSDGVMMFDNGNHHDPPTSSIVEIRFDEATRTAEEVFRYLEPDGRSMNAVGDVRKLPGGNYLIAWTTWGRVDEVTPAGEVSWSMKTTLNYVVTRVRFIEDLYDLPDMP